MRFVVRSGDNPKYPSVRPPRSNGHFHRLRALQSWTMPEATRFLSLIVGIAALLTGALWVGQGAGLIQRPASSFMIDQRPGSPAVRSSR